MGSKHEFENLNRRDFLRDFLKAGAAATAALGAASCSQVKPGAGHSQAKAGALPCMLSTTT